MYQFGIFGTDQRQLYLAEMLKEKGYSVKYFADYEKSFAMEDEYAVILLPVPQTNEWLQRMINDFRQGQIIFGCNVREEWLEQRKDCVFLDYMKQKGFAEQNAVATAEGAVAEGIISSTVNIANADILVAGYGTCGGVIVEKLNALQGAVTVYETEAAAIDRAVAAGYSVIKDMETLKDNLHTFRFIFNTVPEMLFDEKLLSESNAKVCILDIASKPGGVDYTYCKENNIFAKLLPGIPGKYAPEVSAEILCKLVLTKKVVQECLCDK